MDLHVLQWIRHLVKTQGTKILTEKAMVNRLIELSHLTRNGGCKMFTENWEIP